MKKIFLILNIFFLWVFSFNIVLADWDSDCAAIESAGCSSGTHSGECPSGYVEENCSDVSTLSGCPYTCCDCVFDWDAACAAIESAGCSSGTHSGECPSGYVEENCSNVSTLSGCPYTCCDCVLKITSCGNSCTSGSHCKKTDSFTSTTPDCLNPTAPITYTPDCSCNFDVNDSYCISNCKCSSCTSTSFTNDYCGASINNPPQLKEFTVLNNSRIGVSAENENKNHICQSEFNSVRQLTFQAETSDLNGDLPTSGSLTLNGKNIPLLNISGNVLTFGWTGVDIPADYNNSNTAELILTLSDFYGSSGSISTARFFKIWDCKLSISGSIYDATEEVLPYCPSNGFENIVSDADAGLLNLENLGFREIDTTGDPLPMTINTDRVSYISATNYLIWGKEYDIYFNDDISLSDWEMRALGTGSTYCGVTLNTPSVVDPYLSETNIPVDFSGILIQEPWWQTVNGGAISNLSVTSKVPATCTLDNNNCQDDAAYGAYLIAPTINNKIRQDRYLNLGTQSKIANPGTNNYEYFYKQYYAKKGIGKTLSTEGKVIINDSAAQLFSNPSDAYYIYFVNGDLEINDDIDRGSSFLMFIVKGNVTVNANVNFVDGLIVANNIYASSTQDTVTDNPLFFNGSLFAYNEIVFDREFANRQLQNTSPSVKVNYDPELIFQIPGDLAKVLTNWQWGN